MQFELEWRQNLLQLIDISINRYVNQIHNVSNGKNSKIKMSFRIVFISLIQ